MSDDSYKRLKTMFPAMDFVTMADIKFLRECYLNPGTDPGRDMVLSRDTGEVVLSRDICLAFKAIREAFGGPLTATSGFRTEAYQERLRGAGYKAAKKTSTHEYGVALDILVPKGWTAERFARFVKKTLKGQVRIGWKDYGDGTFIHIDVAHLLRDKSGKSPDPRNYHAGVMW